MVQLLLYRCDCLGIVCVLVCLGTVKLAALWQTPQFRPPGGTTCSCLCSTGLQPSGRLTELQALHQAMQLPGANMPLGSTANDTPTYSGGTRLRRDARGTAVQHLLENCARTADWLSPFTLALGASPCPPCIPTLLPCAGACPY